jgi:DNA-binding LacI/PurR family transcriptional regulator
MRTGPRRPTLADVAAAAGVSTALVSIVMRDVPGASPANRARVLEAAERLGYRPDSRARLLRSDHSRLLGVVFGVQDAFHGDLVTGLYDAADHVGYELALSAFTPNRDEHMAIGGLLQDRCEALILLSLTSPVRELAELATRMPTVVLMRSVRETTVDVVRTDDRRGLHQAVDYLVGLGHRRITHIDGGRMPNSADRRRGYQEAMRRNGLTATIQVLPGGPSHDDGTAAAHELLTDPPTAITVYNDRSAIGVLDTLRRAGLDVPRDVSVVGYDDSSAARLQHVALTTVAQDAATLTELAVRRAVERIEGQPVQHREQVVPPHLVIRGTTGPPRHG